MQQSPPQMSACAQKVFGQLQNNLSGNWQYEGAEEEVGGHFNFLFSYSASSATSAGGLASAINGPSLINGARFGAVPSLHIPATFFGGPGASAVGSFLYITAHLDLINPMALYWLGLVPHEIVDVGLGHIIQWLGGSFGC